MPKDKKEGAASGGDGKPFNEKVDEIVGKAIPQKWLGTAFAAAAITTLFFFILMIVGFMSGPKTQVEADADLKRTNTSLETKLERARGDYDKEREAHGVTKTALRGVTSELKQAKRTASSAEGTVASAEKRRDKVQAAFDDQKKEYGVLREKFNKATTDKRAAESKFKRAGGERDKAQASERKIAASLTKTQTSLTKLHAEHDALRNEREDQSKRVADAKAAYERITKTAVAEDDLAERLVLLRTLRDEAAEELDKTKYEKLIAKAIIRVESDIKNQKISATRAAKTEAVETYRSAMDELKMTKDHAGAMEILRKAKKDLDGTRYAVTIHKLIASRETAEKIRLARIVYDAAMKQLKVDPKAFEENLRALETALEQTEDTAYAAKLKKQVDARTKSLAGDLARGAYESLAAQIRKRPPDYDANITAAEDALNTAKDTRYEAKIKGILTSQQALRLRAIGLAAYNACVAQVRGSKDYEANVAELEAQKAKAAGSVYEAKIDKLLVRENKLLARYKARNP